MSEHIQNMPLFAALAEKLNITTLSELGDFSLEQVLAAAGDDVGHADCHALHAEAVRRLALSTTRERQAVTHANPQLLQAPHLGISAPAHAVAYGNDFVPERNNQFVKEGDVSSMFSPAAYLTEMYHNAEQLHDKGNTYHLDTRRPDLATLTLSQDNLDTPLSTLSLSNEILQAMLKKQSQYDSDDKLHTALAQNLTPPEGPYHHAFTGISEALRERDVSPLTLLAPENRPVGNDDVAALCLALGISPALYAQLTTDITFENAKAEYKKVFGDTPPEALLNASALAARYNLPEAMFEEVLAGHVLQVEDTQGKQVNGVLAQVWKLSGDTVFTRIRCEAVEASLLYDGNTLQPSPSGRYTMRFREYTNIYEKYSVRTSVAGDATTSTSSTLTLNLDASPGTMQMVCGIEMIRPDNYSNQAKYIYHLENHTAHTFLLYLHRQALLHKASGVAWRIISAVMCRQSGTGLSDRTLTQLSQAVVYQQRYGLNADDIVVLAGGAINTQSLPGQQSQFDTLFHTPPQNGQRLPELHQRQWDSFYDPLSGKKNQDREEVYKSIVLRGLQADDTSYVALKKLAGTVDNYSNLNPEIINIGGTYYTHCRLFTYSALYRARLLADIHGLTVSELSTLLPLLGFTEPLSEENFSSVVDNVWTATRWLRAQNLSVAGLQALLTELTPVQTPEISSLVLSLRNDVVLPVDANGTPVALNYSNLIPALAPHMASALGLTSPDMTRLVMLWVEQNYDGGVVPFWNAIASLNINSTTFVVPVNALTYCQKLGQLAAIVKGLDLSEPELGLAVDKPTVLNKDATRTTPSVENLMLLSRLHGWVSALGEQASAALTALQKGTLTVKLLAELMSLDGQALAVAAEQAGLDKLSDFIAVERLLQWHQAAQTLNVSAATVGELFAMRFVADAGKPVSTLAQWQTLSGSVLAGLSGRERAAVSAVQDERLSSALSQLYMEKAAPAELKLRTRDDLYGYLLIDSQVSADVTTTRIAEAMASLQLYVNRCMQLGHLESGVKTGALSRTFFREWATYNRRYSTWAGLSQLVYYPENYVDPTQRSGETTMMRTLQQSLNQGQLTQDQVEDAFKTYLAEFEKVADLEIISGYHDGLNNRSGHVWLIGATRESTPVYYWRRVDMSQFKDGAFPATAWSEWQEITVAATPHASLIRPVMRNGRLHLVWVEQRQAGVKDDKPVWTVDLKSAHLRQDGTWSAARVFEDLIDHSYLVDKSTAGLSCLEDLTTNHTYIYIWSKKQDSPSIHGVATLSDGRLKYEHSYDKVPIKLFNSQASLSVCHPLSRSGIYVDANSFTYLGSTLRDERFALIEDAGKNYTLSGELIVKSKFPYSFKMPEVALLTGSGTIIARQALNVGDLTTLGKRLPLALTFPLSAISSTSSQTFTLVLRDDSDGSVSKQLMFNLLRDSVNEHTLLTLHTAQSGAQSMVWGFNAVNRVRLNTLFGPELVRRAARGLDSILSLESQSLPEPAIRPKGARVTLTLDKYSPAVHGLDRTVTLRHTEIFDDNRSDLLFHGELSPDATTQVTVFMKYYDDSRGNKNNFYIEPEYQKGKVNNIRIHKKDGDADVWSLDTGHNNGTFPGLVRVDCVETFDENTPAEPMDFAGANALYFWELFYYAPMLIAQRLLQEQSFDDAGRWLRYVFSPEGYDGNAGHYWNARPLREDICWNDIPLDSTDPDAVAQSDPMHYRVATLMRLLELLTARGDHAYRQLERDTLAEAKMWYVQALALMGDESVTRPAAWAAPTLKDAAGKVVNRLQAMEDRQASPVRILSAQPYTANALTRLFNPQQNARWQAIRQDLTQRLYNLRHNLTLDGQPLTLPLFATPADPAALLSAAAAAGKGGTPLPTGRELGLHRFPLALESARNMTGQLMQFGNALSGVIERQDAEAMAVLMQTQGKALMVQSVAMQKKTLEELGNEAKALAASLAGAQKRQAYYSRLYDENISAGEGFALGARVTAGTLQAASRPLMAAAAAANMAPNIFGMAVGGSQWGSIPFALGMAMESVATGMMTAADGAAQGEMYRRRREEWAMLRDNAEKEVEQLSAQQASLTVRTDAAGLQLTCLETQQAHNEAQLALMQRKFSNQALYNWLRGRLSALYFQFYDLTVSRCLRAEKSFQWETGETRSFIKPGAWQGTYAGLLCGEALMLNLAAMESAYQKWEARALEVERTLSLGERYGKLSTGKFSLKDTIKSQLARGKGEAGSGKDTVSLDKDILSVSVELKGLGLASDYPDGMNLGSVRRIKQISVTLPALLGPYQDVQAVLGYTGTTPLALGCSAIAVSRGMNDSGQFQLDFNDGKYLPFEGIDISDTGTLTLRFPNATGAQKALLASLSDIILHVRYTIRD
ncbi:neuraminidase-like domain-containing protein [Serratia marcescens]|uniref:Tc toxin subunit A-related protein n=1 Tax=Serratia marcescens TaxID=615 RepID=UPI00313CCD36